MGEGDRQALAVDIATYPPHIPDEDHVAEIMRRTGVTESEAWFILALERGELEGDAIELDDE